MYSISLRQDVCTQCVAMDLHDFFILVEIVTAMCFSDSAY